MIISIPDAFRTLQQPWLFDNVTRTIESDIRFNAQVITLSTERSIEELTTVPPAKTTPQNRHLLCRNLSGGNGTQINHIIDEDTFLTYTREMEKHYFPEQPLRPINEIKAARSLSALLQERGIALRFSHYNGRAAATETAISEEALELITAMYRTLPEKHFTPPSFHTLVVGGWGSGAAKGSEYDEGNVHLFDFAIYGARRNFMGLLLHETGHAHYHSLCDRRSDALPQLYDALYLINKSAQHFAVDYGHGEEWRINAFTVSAEEFAAEFYLFYTTQGERLEKFIRSSPQQKAWQRIYDIFQDSFGGVEYR